MNTLTGARPAAASDPAPVTRVRSARRPLRVRFGPDWPLVVLIMGFPLWWALGLSEVMVFVLAIPMALRLIGRRGLVVPRGFGWWMIFLGWMLIGLPLLFADAPSGQTGGSGTRIPVFLYRVVWYLSCTVILLWAGNLSERELSSSKVMRLLGWMFVFITAGGLLGVLAPHFQFTSPFEMILPHRIASNEFIKALSHPQAADIQNVLGTNEARPIAPFAYANSWGSNYSLTLPFFLVSWLGRTGGWRRKVAPVVLLLSAVPVIYSLNRGLWICLILGALVLTIQLAAAGRTTALIAFGVTVVVAVALLFASPLGGMLVERLHHGHSNGRRGELYIQTVESTLKGSPVAGFGSTRKVQGSFDSIAGGSTPGCHACGVPPLGTQGQIWLVIFSQGIGGLIFFMLFFFGQLLQYWRSRTTLQAIGTVLLIFWIVQLFIYDTLGWPLYILMIAIGLMWRERWRANAGENPAILAGVGR